MIKLYFTPYLTFWTKAERKLDFLFHYTLESFLKIQNIMKHKS